MSESNHDKKSNNFGLSEAEFQSLMESLKSGNEELFEKIFVAQTQNSIKLIQSTLGQSYEDSYDATMETLIQFRKCLIQGKLKYGNLKYIFNRMAKFFVLKKLNGIKEFSSDEIEIFEKSNVENKYEPDQVEKINTAWKKLTDQEKKILYLRFNLDARLIDIAQNLGISESAVRKRKQRILDKIKSHFQI